MYEHRHLGSCHIRWTLYAGFLNWNRIFKKNKVVAGKNSVLFGRSMLYSPFYVLTQAFDSVFFYENVGLSILVLSTKKRNSSFLKKVCYFRKFVSKFKYWKRSKFPAIAHKKYAYLLNGGLFYKPLRPFYSRAYAFSVGFKLKPLWKSVFHC